DGIKYKGNRIIFMSTEEPDSLDTHNVEIINSNIDIGVKGLRLLNIPINYFKVFNLETNSQIRITGQHDIYITHSKFTFWSNIDNTIEYNAIFKDNILTDVDGIEPEYPLEDIVNNVI